MHLRFQRIVVVEYPLSAERFRNQGAALAQLCQSGYIEIWISSITLHNGQKRAFELDLTPISNEY